VRYSEGEGEGEGEPAMQPRCERRDVLTHSLGTPMRIEVLLTTFVVGLQPSGRDGIMTAIMPRD